jgi:hypothetical protein
LGCDLESNSSNGNFSHLELSKIGDINPVEAEKEEPFFKGSVAKTKKDNSMDSFVNMLQDKVPFETLAQKEMTVG